MTTTARRKYRSSPESSFRHRFLQIGIGRRNHARVDLDFLTTADALKPLFLQKRSSFT